MAKHFAVSCQTGIKSGGKERWVAGTGAEGIGPGAGWLVQARRA